MPFEGYFWKKKVVLAKKETTYGDDALPVAANVIRAHDLSINPLEADAVDRASVAPYMGAGATRLVGKHVKVSFAVEAAGAGAAGTAPAYKDILKACGLAEIVTPAVDVVYTPVSAGFDSVSIYVNIDGVRYQIKGARGNLSFEMQSKQIPTWKFDFVGLFATPAAAVLPTVDFSAFKDPVEPTKANTPTVLLHGTAMVLVSASFNLNTNPRLVSRCNQEIVRITDRPVSAELSVEKPDIAVANLVAAAAAHTLGVVQLVHGIVAGNIIEIAGPKAQIVRLSEGQADDIVTNNLGLSLKPDVGNDEITITIK